MRARRAVIAAVAIATTGMAAALPIGLASAVPRPVTVTNGAETVSLSSPYAYVMKANGVPAGDQGVITGTGFIPGQNVYVETCNGINPKTTSNYNPSANCFGANAAVTANTSGNVRIDTSNPNYQWGPYHGQDPVDSFFNCLAPGDDPNGTTTAVGGQAIDPTYPSWGASTVGTSGGGTAACQVRIYQLPGTYQASDIFIPITGLDANAVAKAPGAPTNVKATAVPGHDGTAQITFAEAPVTANEGLASAYKVTAINGTTPSAPPVTATSTGTSTVIDVPGLTLGDSYTFTVQGSNTSGTSPVSSASSALVIPGGVAPNAPGKPAVTVDGFSGATVSFTAPSGGGAPTSYKVTATNVTTPSAAPITATGAVSPINISGLVGGDTYTFTVTAINGAGQAVSPSSDPVAIPTPRAPTISGSLPSSVTAGSAYHGQLTITGAPKPTVAASGLPGGLHLSAAGAVTGTATRAGTYVVHVTATNTQGSATRTFTITVRAASASRVVVRAGNRQTVVEGRAFRTALSVVVTDRYGNVIRGDRVTFTVSGPARFGRSATAHAVTSASGLAKAPRLSAERKVGTVTVRATIAKVRTAAIFTLHVKR